MHGGTDVSPPQQRQGEGSRCHTFYKRIPKTNPYQKKKKPNKQNQGMTRSKPKITQTKCGWREEGRRTKCWRIGRRLPVRLSALGPKLWTEGRGRRRRTDCSSPPLPPSLQLSSLVLDGDKRKWPHWTEILILKKEEKKKNPLVWFRWSVLIVLSLLCLLMPFYVLYF